MSVPRYVVKVGGSLLDLPDLRLRLSRWIEGRTSGHYVWIAGGGALADVIRTADAQFKLDEVQCHWWCIQLMEVTARLLEQLLPRARLAESFDELSDSLREQQRDSHTVFAVEHFLRNEEPALPGRPLPHNWSVTSDSIAARIAEAIGARELVLLKSTVPEHNASRNEASARGLVDDDFPMAARHLAKVSCVDFRHDDFPKVKMAFRK